MYCPPSLKSVLLNIITLVAPKQFSSPLSSFSGYNTYVVELLVFVGGGSGGWGLVGGGWREKFGGRVPHYTQFRAVNEVLVPVGRCFYIRPEEVCDDLGGERDPGVDAPETVSAPPRVAQRVERLQAGNRVHGVPAWSPSLIGQSIS